MHWKRLPVVVSAFLVVAVALPMTADHWWGGYHWARTSNPFTLQLGDNISREWDNILRLAARDWSYSSVLDLRVVPGRAGSNCTPVRGRVEVCNARYGRTGWLGIAQVWTQNRHITHAVAKMNDTYFQTATYNRPPWRRFIMCQEIGHTFGLHHQDENFFNPPLRTCEDYTIDPLPNRRPNAHDYAQLEIMYRHLDQRTTALGGARASSQFDAEFLPPELFNLSLNEKGEWGHPLEHGSRPDLYMRDFGGGNRVHTFVFWIADVQ